MRCARKVYDVKEWTIIRGIQLCPKKPIATATAADEKPTFDCALCNKPFPKIHFLFVLSICLPTRLLSSLSSLIVISYPFDPGLVIVGGLINFILVTIVISIFAYLLVLDR